MNIVMIGPRRLYPDPQGGLDFYVRELSEFLAMEGHHITICEHRQRTRIETPLPDGITLKSIWTPKAHHIDTLFYGLVATLRSLFLRETIAHFHGGAAIYAFLPRLFRKKIIVTIHSQEWKSEHIAPVWRPFYRLGEWIACRTALRVSAVSRTVADDLQNRYGRKVVVLPLGITLRSRSTHYHLMRLGLLPKRYLLFLGRLERGKGVEHLLEAYRSLKGVTEIPLVIAGEPLYDRDYFERLKNSSGPNVRFLGKVTGSLKEELFANTLLYLQASQAEGMSISLLEAMSYGCPILVSDIAQNEEALGEAGCYFRNADPEDLRKQLESLLTQSSKLGEMGELAKKKIREERSWEKVRPILQQLYSS